MTTKKKKTYKVTISSVGFLINSQEVGIIKTDDLEEWYQEFIKKYKGQYIIKNVELMQ